MKAAGFLVGRVGDAVMCSVAARQFKEQYPDAHLTFALGKQFGNVIGLFKDLPYVDDVHVWEGTDDWPTPKDIEYIKANGYDLVFNGLARHTRWDWYNHYHYVEETCLMLGLNKPTDLRCQLGYKPRKIEGYENTITTSLFASGDQIRKTFSMDKVEALFAAIRAMGYRVVQVGSTDRVIEGADNLRGDIYEAIDAIHSSRLHLSIDTAFAWIASAYEKPLIGFYAIDYADMPLHRLVSHNPVNANATYFNLAKINDISIDEVVAVIKAKLS